MSTPERELYDPFFETATKDYDLPANMLRQLAAAESNFNSGAVSPKGAVGLMQIMPNFHPDVDPTDPYASIDYAGKLLRGHYDEFGSWELALAAYNAGPGTVRRNMGIPLDQWQGYEETKAYVPKIMGNLGNVSVNSEQNPLDLMLNKQRESLGIPNPTRSSSAVPDIPDIPEREGILEAIKSVGGAASSVAWSAIKSGVGKVREHRRESLESMGPEERETYDRTRANSGPGALGLIGPTGVASASVAARVGVLRRFSPFRSSGAKLAGVAVGARNTLPAVSAASNAPASLTQKALNVGKKAVDAAVSYEDEGYKVWNAGMGGDNPSQFIRFMQNVPEDGRALLQKGMFRSLQENLANMNHLTKSARQNLLSPSGQIRLAETFRGAPPEYLVHFNRLVETGQFQNLTRFVIAASLAFPWARKAGQAITSRLEGDVY